MIRVFLDANVLYSAADSPEGLNAAIFKVAGKRGDVELIANRYVCGEADINLMYKSLSRARVALKKLVTHELTIEPNAPLSLTQRMKPHVPNDPADAPVLAGAVFAKADWLITSNSKDFGHLYETVVDGVLVLRPKQAFDRLTLEE